MKVLLVGATGLVGSHVLELLEKNESIKEIYVLTRRTLAFHHSPKIKECVVDFQSLDPAAQYYKVDAVISCLGTTISKAGSKEAFRKVDFGLPLQIAIFAKGQGASHFLLVSALGADARSRIFYNRVKGELEESLMALNFSSLTIVRPSILVGARKERRLLESIGQYLGRKLPLQWRAVPADRVARSLVHTLTSHVSGISILKNQELF